MGIMGIYHSGSTRWLSSYRNLSRLSSTGGKSRLAKELMKGKQKYGKMSWFYEIIFYISLKTTFQNIFLKNAFLKVWLHVLHRTFYPALLPNILLSVTKLENNPIYFYTYLLKFLVLINNFFKDFLLLWLNHKTNLQPKNKVGSEKIFTLIRTSSINNSQILRSTNSIY